jgi:glycosyltransferase involved in cell wall biosynthesis
VSGSRKRELIARACALLCPISWEEPGGTAVIEALASGTPVIGFRLGCLPTLIEHGVTGFLADREDELAGYLAWIGELDPATCRGSAARRYSSGTMAARCVELYDEVFERTTAATRSYAVTSNTA